MIRHITVVEPCATRAEVESFNQLVQLSPLPLTFHMPALIGPESLFEEKPPAGILVMGSTANVQDRSPWQLALTEWLGMQIEKRVPVFGICFAHQLIAQMYGGKVEKMPAQELGFRKTKLQANTLWGTAREANLFVTHHYEVTQVPEDFECIGTSDKVRVSAMAHRSKPIWTFQSHPESSPAFVEREDMPRPSGSQLRDGQELVKRFLQLCASR